MFSVSSLLRLKLGGAFVRMCVLTVMVKVYVVPLLQVLPKKIKCRLMELSVKQSKHIHTVLRNTLRQNRWEQTKPKHVQPRYSLTLLPDVTSNRKQRDE